MGDDVRNAAAISPEERHRIRREHGLSGFIEYDDRPGWQLCEVRPQALRVVHGDFRGEPLTKGELFSTYLRCVRAKIDSGDFQKALEIRGDFPNKPPIYVLRTRNNQELYVLDGELRTLNACYHAEDWIPALLVDVDEQREIVD
jgi:hypothetical protein